MSDYEPKRGNGIGTKAPSKRRWRLETQFGDVAHPAFREALVTLLAEVKADIAVIDTYGKAIPLFKGGVGNENTDANAFIQRLVDVAQAVSVQTGRPLTWILIHHQGWENGRPRGSSQFPQASDIVLQFEPYIGRPTLSRT